MIEEGTDYTRGGWRPGDIATLENRPMFKVDLDAWNAAGDKQGFNAEFRRVADEAHLAYEQALSPEQRAERARIAEERLMQAAHEFYASRPAGSNRSFWD